MSIYSSKDIEKMKREVSKHYNKTSDSYNDEVARIKSIDEDNRTIALAEKYGDNIGGEMDLWKQDLDNTLDNVRTGLQQDNYNDAKKRTEYVNQQLDTLAQKGKYYQAYLKAANSSETGQQMLVQVNSYLNAIKDIRTQADQDVKLASKFANENDYKIAVDNINNSYSESEKQAKKNIYISDDFKPGEKNEASEALDLWKQYDFAYKNKDAKSYDDFMNIANSTEDEDEKNGRRILL